jgi:hypothetical protein
LEIGEVNPLHERLVTIEENLSLFGQVIIIIKKYPGKVPIIE